MNREGVSCRPVSDFDLNMALSTVFYRYEYCLLDAVSTGIMIVDLYLLMTLRALFLLRDTVVLTVAEV
jgi:hypothetical protein